MIKALAREAQNRVSKASAFPLRVQCSAIHRLGVFAGQQIRARARVIEYAGEKISRRETRHRFLEICRGRNGGRNYLAQLNSYWAIDGAVGGNGAELINHSCQPNLALRGFRGRLWLVSLRRIRKGEELAYDYKFDKNGVKTRCQCGSANCRGTINLR